MIFSSLILVLLGALLGVAFDRLTRYLRKRNLLAAKKERTAKIEQIAAAKRKIDSERLTSEVLGGFYSPIGLKEQHLCRYVVSVKGKTTDTAVVTRKEWRNLRLRIAPNSEECSLTESSGVPTLSGREREALLGALKKEGRRIDDKPIFRLVSFDISSDTSRFNLALDRFYNYLCSTGALERELYQALIDSDFYPQNVIKDSQRFLPLRSRFLPDAAALMNPGNRMCAGGPHVLLAFRRPKESGNDYAFFARRRSAEVATGDRLISMVPMGYHQPTSESTTRDEIPLAMSIYREIYEELFGGKEVEETSDYAAPGWYLKKYHPLAWLMDNPKSCRSEIVSFGISLVPGNYEFAVLLVVDDPEFWARFNGMIQLNWEVNDTQTPLISTANAAQLAWLVMDRLLAICVRGMPPAAC